MSHDCPLCGRSSQIRFEENIRHEDISGFTYASRKRPELMHYAYYECTSCRHLFSVEDVSLSELFANYRDADYDSSVESMYAARTYARAVRAIVGRSGISLLDVGCGDGAFLRESIRTGLSANPVGVEPSLAAVAAADALTRPHIRVGPLEDLEFDSRFDLVTFFQTVEHVRDPIHFLGRLRELVAFGGHLVIVGHDWTSPVNRMLGTSSPIFDIEHLQVFSRTSLHVALHRIGATEITIRPIWNTYPVQYWLKVAPPSVRWMNRVVPSFIRTSIPVSLPVGNLVAVAQFD